MFYCFLLSFQHKYDYLQNRQFEVNELKNDHVKKDRRIWGGLNKYIINLGRSQQEIEEMIKNNSNDLISILNDKESKNYNVVNALKIINDDFNGTDKLFSDLNEPLQNNKQCNTKKY